MENPYRELDFLLPYILISYKSGLDEVPCIIGYIRLPVSS